jgi:hypothetical protein
MQGLVSELSSSSLGRPLPGTDVDIRNIGNIH